MNFRVCKRLISESLRNHYHRNNESQISCRLFLVFYSSSVKTPTQKNSSVSDLLRKHGFSSQIIANVASKLPSVKDANSCEPVLSFFKENGFSTAHLEKLVNSEPKVLAARVKTTIKPKIQFFQDFGFSPADIADVFSSDPWVLFRSTANSVEPSVRVLTELLGSGSEVAKLLKVSGTFLKCNLKNTMLPNIELLKSCGINEDRIIRQIFSFPRFCLHKPENMRKFIHKVDELGCDRDSKMYLHAIRTVASMSEDKWRLKMDFFQKLGFSEKQILSMFHRRPQVFAISCRKIENSVQVLLDTGNHGLSYVFDHPEILICSVEKRLKPRLQIIDILVSRNLIKKRPSLSTIYKYTELKFFQKFVSPHLDIKSVSEFGLYGK